MNIARSMKGLLLVSLGAALACGPSDDECDQNDPSSDCYQPPKGNQCESTDVPSKAGCANPDLGVFVDKSGKVDGTGTQTNPASTIVRGIAIAKEKGVSRVYVCGTDYSERVTLSSPINLYGGFNCADWKYKPGDKAAVRSPNNDPALRVAGASKEIAIEDFLFQSQDATQSSPEGNGLGSIAAIVSQSIVTFSRVDFQSGRGSDGLSADTPPTNWSDTKSMKGSLGTSNTGGTGGTATCVNGNKSTGGAGGNYTSNPGSAGTPAAKADPDNYRDGAGGPIPGEVCHGPDEASDMTMVAHHGADGEGGAGGTSSASFGKLTASWIPDRGGSGATGKPGQGGGGIGGALSSPSYVGGSGGGAGGCGGNGGLSGGAGGASIALGTIKATVKLRSCTLTAGDGGNGGNGSAGEGGQGGAQGGFDDSGEKPMCGSGTWGGNGGGGGGGAGGNGGMSVGVFFAESAPDMDDNTFVNLGNPGTGGAGGPGGLRGDNPLGTGRDGSEGGPGNSGPAEETLEFTP